MTDSSWTNEQYDHMVAQVRAGRAAPLAESQARWDRLKVWAQTQSLAQMVVLEETLTGVRLSRERIRSILKRARPGSVARSKMKTYEANLRHGKATLARWKGKQGVTAERMIAKATADVAQAQLDIKAEKKRLAART